MNCLNRMSVAQATLLREVRDRKITAAQLEEKCHADGKRSAIWFGNPFFVRNLDRIVKRRVRVSVSIGALAATEARQMIVDGVRSGAGLEEKFLRTCQALMEQSRSDMRLFVQLRKQLAKKKPKAPADGGMRYLHPSFRGREREFLKLMKGG